MEYDSQFLTVHRSIATGNLHTLEFCKYVVCTTEHAEPQFDHLIKTPWDLFYFPKSRVLHVQHHLCQNSQDPSCSQYMVPSAIFSSGALEVMCNRLCRSILSDIGMRNRSANSFRPIKTCVVTVNCKTQTCPFALFVMFVTGYLSTLRQNIDIHPMIDSGLCTYF